MVHIKIFSVAFILAVAAIAPVVALPVPNQKQHELGKGSGIPVPDHPVIPSAAARTYNSRVRKKVFVPGPMLHSAE